MDELTPAHSEGLNLLGAVFGAAVLCLLLTSNAVAQCAAGQCLGDGDGDNSVRINELVGSVGNALSSCESEDAVCVGAETQLARGERLIFASGCPGCHTPRTPEGAFDTTKWLAGYAPVFPLPEIPEGGCSTFILVDLSTQWWCGFWGVSWSTNLTPDPTGLGNLTEEMFINSFRTGKHFGDPLGRDILPPMVFLAAEYSIAYSDGDLKDLWAYLRSIPPIENRVPLPIPPGG